MARRCLGGRGRIALMIRRQAPISTTTRRADSSAPSIPLHSLWITMTTRAWRNTLAIGGAALLCGGVQGGQPRTTPLPPAFSALPLAAPSPPDNPSTPEKVALGRLLFWDPILSGGRDTACATCHHPAQGYADGRDLPIGTGGKGIGPVRAFPGGAGPI